MIYALMLNDMREPNIENIRVVKISGERQVLADWYTEQKVEPYRDGRWGKTFRAGSELEWFNDGDLTRDNAHFGGIYLFPDDVDLEALRSFALVKG